tara:strand:+ start:165 stop:455 length:291 start_codon:yes stop_codon:yes gene_type:complete
MGRKKGATTKKDCFNLKIVFKDEVIFNEDFKTLKNIADELSFTYNRVIEMTRGRKKELNGKYEPKYIIGKIKYTKDGEKIYDDGETYDASPLMNDE